MPDQLTPEHPATPPETAADPAGPWPTTAEQADRRPTGGWQAPVVVVLFLVAGALLGVLWEQLWTPTEGRVVRREWFVVDDQLRYDLDGLRNEFAGTALFVWLGVGAGLLVGAFCSVVLARRELRTLGSVLVGSVLGSLVMWQVGTRLGPEDPEVLARTAPRGSVLPDNLELGSLGALLAMPLGACVSLLAVFLLLPARRRRGDRP